MLKSIINKVANEERIDPVLIEDAFKDQLLRIKSSLQRPDMPKVLINGFGSFKPNISYINMSLRRSVWSYKNGKMTKERLRQKFEYLMPVKRRLEYEKKRKKIQRSKSNARKQVKLNKGQTD